MTDASKLSVIVPARNEELSLPSTLARALQGTCADVLVVDGASTDRTAEVAREAGARVLSSAPGRALQMNSGARAARGDLLLFLHADTLLPPGFEDVVGRVLADTRVAAGAFRLAIEGAGPALACIAGAANLRSRLLGLPFGDQALFLRRSTFEELGGFRELAVLEDYELVRRLKRRGRVVLARESVLTSARRWEAQGIVQTTLRHQLVLLGFHAGLGTGRLAQLRPPLAQQQAPAGADVTGAPQSKAP